MSVSNDMLTALLIYAWFLHILTLLGMALHTALAPEPPHDDCGHNRTLRALFLGRAPIQRTGRNTLSSRLLMVSGLLLAAASVMSLAKEAALTWTAVIAVLALTQLASSYAWYKPASVNTAGRAEQDPPKDTAAESDDEADGEEGEEAPKGPGSN